MPSPLLPLLAKNLVKSALINAGNKLSEPYQEKLTEKFMEAVSKKPTNVSGPDLPPAQETFPEEYPEDDRNVYKKGGKVKRSSASKRGDGIAQRGKTKGRMV